MVEIPVEVGMVLEQNNELACDIIVDLRGEHGNCSYITTKSR
jgi:hypothetical protein